MTKAKGIIAIAALVVLPTTLLGACILNEMIFQTLNLTSTSPAGSYSVALKGQAERPLFPGVVHSVWFNVVKDKEPFISERRLHSGDWLDPSFSMLYPEHDWLDETILHFYRAEYFRRGKANTVITTNRSDKTIKFLKVTADDMYLLFDLAPGSTTKFSISPARGSLTYISVEGEFSNNVKIEKKGENFRAQQVTEQQVDYYINIDGALPSIESPHFEKYKPH